MAEKPDRTTYQITKYNFRTAEQIEVYPKLVRGLANAERTVERFERELTKQEREEGVRWYLRKATRISY